MTDPTLGVSTGASTQDVVTAAIGYAKRGWRVIPLHGVKSDGTCTCGKCPAAGRSIGKHPINAAWQNAPALSAPDIMETWARYPWANLGVATGEVSGFFVLDIDVAGFETMARLIAEHGHLPPTATQMTGSGGWHYLFALPDFEVRNKQGGMGSWKDFPGVDIRGNGGQIVIAPSISGKGPYVLNDAPIAPAPQWLLEALSAPAPDDEPAPASVVAAGPLDASEAARLGSYTQRAVDSELARLGLCMDQGWQGPPWNATTHAVACNLVELANSPWNGLTMTDAYRLLLERAPRDENFGVAEIKKCFGSAQRKIGTTGRPLPPRPPDLLAGLPFPSQAAPPAARQTFSWDDLGNADRIVAMFGDRIRWVSADLRWSVYDGVRWATDGSGAVIALVQSLLANLVRLEAEAYDDVTLISEDGKPGKTMRAQFKAWAPKQRMAARVEAAEKMARAKPVLQAAPSDFDADPMMLNCRNGAVDLRTGTLHPHRPEHLFSQVTNVDYIPDAPAPHWEEFLAEVMPDRLMRAYLQRCAGYSITGDISEQAMFIHQGAGANGKSVFLIAMQQVLGDYNQIVPRTTLLTKGGDAIPTDIARMLGKRFLQTSETAAGKRLDEEITKSLTGGESVVARHLFGREFEFTPSGKIHYVTNHLPRLTDAESIWRRLHLFSWRVVIPEGEQVKNLGRLLASDEARGILAWLVQGCLSWQQVGLGRPESSKADLLAYRTDQDELGEFLDDYILPTTGGRSTMEMIYRAYQQWVASSGLGNKALTRQTLSLAMRERGYQQYRTAKTRGFLGVSVQLPSSLVEIPVPD